MQCQFLDPEFARFADGLPQLPQTALVMASVRDFRAELLVPEDAELSRMAEIRQFGFSSGRHCAHLAQRLLGLEPSPVLRKDRVPVWPGHSVGSITHSRKIAAAMASTGHTGVGIDIEQSDRVVEKLHRLLFTNTEQEALRDYEFDAATIMFSAKEAGYKAIYPIGETFIGFHQAEIALQVAEQTFTIKYLGDHSPNKALETGIGYWVEHHGHILTIFMLP